MSFQGTSVTGSSHVLSLNLRLEIHIFLLLGMRIWLAYLDRGRIGPCDGTPKRRGGGEFTSGDGELLEEMLNNAQPSRCSWSPSSPWCLPHPTPRPAGHMFYYVCICSIFLSLLTDLLGLLIYFKMADSASKCLPQNKPGSQCFGSNVPGERPWWFQLRWSN